MAVKFRDSRIGLPVDPDVALTELERIRLMSDGKLQAKTIVQESEPKTAPLHAVFEWRNAVAGHLYRQWQARNLIKAVRVEVIDDEGKRRDNPVYVNVRVVDTVTGKHEQYYQSTEVAIKHFDEWTSAVMEAQKKLESAQKAIGDLQRIANGDSDRLAYLTIATRSIDAAIAALQH